MRFRFLSSTFFQRLMNETKKLQKSIIIQFTTNDRLFSQKCWMDACFFGWFGAGGLRVKLCLTLIPWKSWIFPQVMWERDQRWQTVNPIKDKYIRAGESRQISNPFVPRTHHQIWSLQFEVNLLDKTKVEKEHSVSHSHCTSQP